MTSQIPYGPSPLYSHLRLPVTVFRGAFFCLVLFSPYSPGFFSWVCLTPFYRIGSRSDLFRAPSSGTPSFSFPLLLIFSDPDPLFVLVPERTTTFCSRLDPTNLFPLRSFPPPGKQVFETTYVFTLLDNP